MSLYSKTKYHFENEYRKFIDKYVSQFVTTNEIMSLREIKCQKNLHLSDMHTVILQNRYSDKSGWVIKKCDFVEKYLWQNAGNKCVLNTISLCLVDNQQDSGLVIYNSLPRKDFEDLVREYTLTEIENSYYDVSIEDRLDFARKYNILRKISGVDTNGWLECKRRFVENMGSSESNITDCTGSAILEVLQAVKRDVQNKLFDFIQS